MPARKHLSSSTHRRRKLSDRILCEGVITMRPCSSCTSQGVLCVLSHLDERCEQCYRHQRQCDLASPWAEDDRLKKKGKKLREQRLEAETKAARLRKQKRLLLKRRRALWKREGQNIDKLEVNKAAAEALKPFAEKQP
jgi:hypothetical protein